jgi:Caspase domain
MSPARALLLVAVACFAVGGRSARADEEDGRPVTFALLIGSNRSVDADVPPLKYADDDAARYLDLFRLLGARTYLLSSLDENTRRLHPQAAAEAVEPNRAALEQTLEQLIADVSQARDRHVETTVYFFYAGHGNVDDSGTGYISLEDMRITGADLAHIFARIPATRLHVIADACASYMLAYSRGPGGERRPVRGFQDSAQLANDPRVGLLLSTSSARESHEWDAYQAGVFSHEVRSGLYGAADADGDGRVSYQEIAAFVSRANAEIPNERYRPDVHAKAPAGSDTLMDLRPALGRRLDIDGAHAAHYWIEDGQGVRLADFHNAAGQAVHLVRPAPSGHVYVRRSDDDAEFTVPAWPSAIALADLAPAPPRVASRGAAQEAFEKLFALPFDENCVQTYREAPPDDPTPIAGSRGDAVPRGGATTRAVVGWTVVGFGAAALSVGAVFSVSAVSASHGASTSLSEAEVASRNGQIATDNTAAAVAYAAGGVAIASGLAALLWPEARHVQAGVTGSGGYVGYGGTF